MGLIKYLIPKTCQTRSPGNNSHTAHWVRKAGDFCVVHPPKAYAHSSFLCSCAALWPAAGAFMQTFCLAGHPPLVAWISMGILPLQTFDRAVWVFLGFDTFNKFAIPQISFH